MLPGGQSVYLAVTSNSTTQFAYVMSNGTLGVGVSDPALHLPKVTTWTRTAITARENADRDS